MQSKHLQQLRAIRSVQSNFTSTPILPTIITQSTSYRKDRLFGKSREDSSQIARDSQSKSLRDVVA